MIYFWLLFFSYELLRVAGNQVDSILYICVHRQVALDLTTIVGTGLPP